MHVELLGRSDLLQELREAPGDIVIIGKPGIGKTSVVQHLVEHSWGLFDVGSSANNVANAVRAMEPRRIIVEALVIVVRLRAEEIVGRFRRSEGTKPA